MKQVRGIVAATLAAVGAVAVSGPLVAQTNAPDGSGPGVAEALYILKGGAGHAGNLSSWANMTVPPGTPVDIGANAHLIKHARGWMMFDTSTNDIIATMPDGYGESAGGIRWTKSEAETLPRQFKAIGITADDIRYIGISHTHADHIGNIHQFPNAVVLIQRREYESAFRDGGAPAGPPTFAGQIFPRQQPVSLLDGDYDVFGDGSVMLYYVGGHTPGSQVCVVRLADTGAVLLTGDAVHLQSNWDTRRIPRIERANDENKWALGVWAAYDRIEHLLGFHSAQLWIHHDIEGYKNRKVAPEFYK